MRSVRLHKTQLFLLFIGCFIFCFKAVSATEIERFEHLTNDNGLSQNTITSIHCDSKGFLWFGTYNGLNRFDGYHFKVYQNNMNTPGIFTNNRVISIWEDKKEFLWFETYDGYYHRFNILKETFSTLPKYLQSAEEKYSTMNCFFQYSDNEIWLGSSNSGVYRLTFDPVQQEYISSQFLSRGQYALSNNNVRFIIADRDSNLYIGTKNGLNLLRHEDNKAQTFYFQHFFSDFQFTCGAVINNEVWLGTENNGLVVYNIDTKSFYIFNKENSPLNSNHIDLLKVSSQGNVLIGSSDLHIYLTVQKQWLTVNIDGERIDKIFEDYKGLFWVTTSNFGVQQVNQHTGTNKHFDLTPANQRYLSDKPRPYFYEDLNKTLWICVHGAGLAQYRRDEGYFHFFRNDPTNPKSISSNTVMCMTEDHNGTLWVGAGLEGGINKVILKNPAFTSLQFSKKFDDYVENIVRAIMEDKNHNIWVASKGGEIKLYNKSLKTIEPGITYPFKPRGSLVFNVYSMLQDSRGYIWIGSKGAGIAVSKYPVDRSITDYSKIAFHQYMRSEGDSTSLCNNNVYSIDEDATGRIWIGTYGGGLSVTKTNKVDRLTFTTVNTENANLSNDMIRNVMFDSGNNLWVATTFGLNRLSAANITDNRFDFDCFYHDPENTNSLTYNDVVHVFEDSKNNIWIGTFGGGVNMLTPDHQFKKFTNIDGLCNNEVYGIIEDNQEQIWLSTGNGLSRLNPRLQSFDNYNKSNNLTTNSFSENTCLKTHDGRIVFGSIEGIEVIEPEKIKSHKYNTQVIFTQFQLFNKDVDVNTIDSPLTQSIISTREIVLKHNQSSFSVEYSAMNFLDESKTQYAYFLQNFDENWNYVGTQRKATYTNLKPGTYILKVKAALWNGNWENEETSILITIKPPWWQTQLAYIIYLIVFTVSTFLISRGVIKVNSFRNELRIEKAVNEAKLQFFTNISHEIRTPLTLILGPIEDVLSDAKFPSDYRSTLNLMQKNGKRMLHLLNQLLDFRKVQNKKMNLYVAPIDLVEFTKSIFDNFVPHARHMHVNFKFSVKSHPEKVWIDPNRIDSVIFNILSNAFKFTPKGQSIEVIIDENQKSGEVYIKVADSGPGIKSKDIPLIFNRYSILGGENESLNGTGIGLNLSNEFIKLHGGEIRVENQTGKGCVFVIVLKTGKAHLTGLSNIIIMNNQNEISHQESKLTDILVETSPPLTSIEPVKTSGEKKTLLVVEDNVQILNYISDSLSSDYSILTAKDGHEGLDIATHFNPDLIISDIMMPVIDGIEMTRKLKENFDTCHIPIILLTAKSSVDDQILGIESGAEAYVLKPFNMPVLKSMIHNMLEQRNLVLKKYRDKMNVEVSSLNMSSRNKVFLDKVVKYIEENYTNPDLNIASLVETSSVSRTVFYNKIKSLTGLSPIELVRQIKLKIAAQLLLNGYNVNEAAYQIGFNDSRYFSKQFKELIGESPSQYKKRNCVEENML